MNFDAIGRYAEEVICGERGLPGCDLLIMREHELLYRHTCGFADAEKTKPTDKNALYYMYSCTKPLTAALGVRLIEDGRLRLDAPVSDYLPEYATLTVRDGDTLRPAVRPLTVRHLFTMTGGFDYNMYTPEVRTLLAKRGEAATTREIIACYAKAPLHFDPGERFAYSLGLDILAAVIEVAAEMSFGEYMKKIILDPLEMQDASLSDTSDRHARIATLSRVIDGRVQPHPEKHNELILTAAYESGGAGLICTAEDYLKFADALASGGVAKNGYRLLSADSLALLHTEQLSGFAVNSAFTCTVGTDYGYALGVRTRLHLAGGRGSLGEFGWDGAAGSYVLIDPKERLSIFFATHTLNWPSIISGEHNVLRNMTYEALNIGDSE